MSARNLRVELSAKASRDARSIQLFTVKQWGSEQAALYDEAILQALETLRSHPELGRHRKELGLDLRSYRVNSHTIFYRVIGDRLFVSRILHHRMEADPEQLT